MKTFDSLDLIERMKRSSVLLIGNGAVGASLGKQLDAAGVAHRHVSMLSFIEQPILNRKQFYEYVFVAGLPGSKWKANLNTVEDVGIAERLTAALGTFMKSRSTDPKLEGTFPAELRGGIRLFLVSTIATKIPTYDTYGSVRRSFEGTLAFRASKYANTLRVYRLPMLVGEGVVKNSLYDLLNDNSLPSSMPQTVFDDLSALTRSCSPYLELREDFRVPAVAGRVNVDYYPNREAFKIDGLNTTSLVNPDSKFVPYHLPDLLRDISTLESSGSSNQFERFDLSSKFDDLLGSESSIVSRHGESWQNPLAVGINTEMMCTLAGVHYVKHTSSRLSGGGVSAVEDHLRDSSSQNAADTSQSFTASKLLSEAVSDMRQSHA